MNDSPAITKTQQRFEWTVLAMALILLLLDLWVHRLDSFHPHFAFERWFGFFGWLGALATLVLTAIAVGWRRSVRRPEGYYDE
jgi:hypothetical protein